MCLPAQALRVLALDLRPLDGDGVLACEEVAQEVPQRHRQPLDDLDEVKALHEAQRLGIADHHVLCDHRSSSPAMMFRLLMMATVSATMCPSRMWGKAWKIGKHGGRTLMRYGFPPPSETM